MPYTKKVINRTPVMMEAIKKLVPEIKQKGDLNYVVCEVIGQLILRDGIGYTTISNWIDALPDAEDECRRRLLHPYEDLKKIENGDVESFTEILERIK
jgi:hypothetical protein